MKQVGGKWQSNNFKMSKKQVLVNVTKVFNERGVIHYPCDNQNLNQCNCGQKTHGIIQAQCNFYLYSQFGKPPFSVVEIQSRLRLYN